jgi:hypothetical protein
MVWIPVESLLMSGLLSIRERTPDAETNKENDPITNKSDTASLKVRKTHSPVVSSSDKGEQLDESSATSKARRTCSRVV